MIEALWYGLVASLSFLGFLSALFLILIHIYSPFKHGSLIINLTDDLSENEAYNTVCGLFLIDFLFGCNEKDRISILNNSDVAYLYDALSTSECIKKFECFTYDEFLIKMKQEE